MHQLRLASESLWNIGPSGSCRDQDEDEDEGTGRRVFWCEKGEGGIEGQKVDGSGPDYLSFGHGAFFLVRW